MNNKFFILSDEVYNNGLFPQIPNYRKEDSWFLLTGGTANDIIVNDRTTVRQIRHGKYKRLVEISQKAHTYIHTFNSPCKETSYTFNVTIKAIVLVEDPISFYSNLRSVNVQDFFNNQFSLDVRRIAREHSILVYSGMDDKLIDILPRARVLDSCGMAYQIQTVETMPNEAALKVLQQTEQIGIENYIEQQKMAARLAQTKSAGAAAQINKGKTYEDAIWQSVALGKLTDIEAVQKIDDYNLQSHVERFKRLIALRDEGMITNADIELQKVALLPPVAVLATQHDGQGKSEKEFPDDVELLDELFPED